jgi:hypothetical protein
MNPLTGIFVRTQAAHTHTHTNTHTNTQSLLESITLHSHRIGWAGLVTLVVIVL